VRAIQGPLHQILLVCTSGSRGSHRGSGPIGIILDGIKKSRGRAPQIRTSPLLSFENGPQEKNIPKGEARAPTIQKRRRLQTHMRLQAFLQDSARERKRLEKKKKRRGGKIENSFRARALLRSSIRLA